MNKILAALLIGLGIGFASLAFAAGQAGSITFNDAYADTGSGAPSRTIELNETGCADALFGVGTQTTRSICYDGSIMTIDGNDWQFAFTGFVPLNPPQESELFSVSMFDLVISQIIGMTVAVSGVALGIFALFISTKFGVKVLKQYFPNAN